MPGMIFPCFYFFLKLKKYFKVKNRNANANAWQIQKANRCTAPEQHQKNIKPSPLLLVRLIKIFFILKI